MTTETPDGPDEVGFKPPPGPTLPVVPDDLAAKEAGVFAGQKENAVCIPLWRGGYINFNPKDSVSIFALLSLVLLLSVAILITIFGIWISADATEWMTSLVVALGHAITGVVGAIVGSAAAKKD